MELKHEEHLDHCPCCSTGDYSELFSDKKSEKRTNLRMGILYFIILVLASINKYFTLISLIISICIIAYFYYKKDKDYLKRSLFLIIFCIIGYLVIKFQ